LMKLAPESFMDEPPAETEQLTFATALLELLILSLE
jgi:hypothetical protein